MSHVFIRCTETNPARFFGQQPCVNELIKRLLSQIHLLGELWSKTFFVDFTVVGLDVPIGSLELLKGDRLVVDRYDYLYL